MPNRQHHYVWEWTLASSPEALWPLLSDTNRLDHDSGLPTIERLGPSGPGQQRVRQRVMGMEIVFDELPFEWVRPHRWGVLRTYLSGPLREARVQVDLHANPDGGTRLVFAVSAWPRNRLVGMLVPLQMRVMRRKFSRAIEAYDRFLQRGGLYTGVIEEVHLARGGQRRLAALAQTLQEQTDTPAVLQHLVDLILSGDDLTVSRLRPYALARHWGTGRRPTLEVFLRATRLGILDLQWDLLCPMCRGAAESQDSLGKIASRVHCEGCNIDFTVNFDHSVELTFRPNASIREVSARRYCTGGPGATPHVVVQRRLAGGARETMPLQLEEGRYRLRCPDVPGGRFLRVEAGGANSAELAPDAEGWPRGEAVLSPAPTLTLANPSSSGRVFILERTAWSDEAATGAEVSVLQVFRDLFAGEALRPGEEISVGSLAVLFTDLRASTRMYREIGDAYAFGRVMSHFDVLKSAISREDGALVKTIGDAVMAAFRRPASALRALLAAQRALAAAPAPLRLKAGLHVGPCIAVTLNQRLDYFGSTVNMAARLEGLSSGEDVVVSGAVVRDPEVGEMIASGEILAGPFQAQLRGFDEEAFDLWRIKAV